MSEGRTAGSTVLSPPESGVAVRMYRPGGLGDCFLLAFPAGDGGACYVLVDCGVLLGTRGGADRMRKIAQDIARATANHLHVVVATHEHWDHLSGFQYAQSVFDAMVIDQVWLSWAEDPGDPLAMWLRDRHTRALWALYAAFAALDAENDPKKDVVEGLLGFFGPTNAMLGVPGTAGQLEYVRRFVEKPQYCRPGAPPLKLPGVPGLRVHVLGPPRDEALLTRSDPSRERGEVYGAPFSLDTLSTLDELSSFCDAALAGGEAGDMSRYDLQLLARSNPFPRFTIPLGEALSHPESGSFFRHNYGFGPENEGHGPAWRRIDTVWLSAAEALALRLDNDTNNTGLVLAFELEESGKVLLFAADAQVGSWLSWHDVPCGLQGEAGSTAVTGSDLLRRTVLYKVAHHGSHNATLRERGLEAMDSPELVAMLPVDREQAHARNWMMPFHPLLDRLRDKTRGRVLRTDVGLPGRPDSVSVAEWQRFCDNVQEDPGPHRLWLQYTVPRRPLV